MKNFTLVMTETEVKPVSILVEDLQDGEVLFSATAEHTPPTGGTPTTITPSILDPYVNLLIGPLTTPGRHYVRVQAVGDNGSKPEVVYHIRVRNS